MSTWVFLRGLTRESRHWGEFPATFERAVPGARVHALDLPGNGALHRMASPHRVGEMAEWCRAALSRESVEPPYNLLALSLGGMVALAWAHAYSAEIGRSVLINTSVRTFSPLHRRLRPRSYPLLLKLMLFGGDASEWEKTILTLTSARNVGDAALLDRWVAWRQEHPVTRSNAWRQLYAAARFRAPAQKPAAPLLILVSEKDKLVHPDCSKALASAWNCELRTHLDAGHDLPLDDGPWVAEEVRKWIVAQNDRTAPAFAVTSGDGR